jgi:uncharacterized protein with LGFP repeats
MSDSPVNCNVDPVKAAEDAVSAVQAEPGVLGLPASRRAEEAIGAKYRHLGGPGGCLGKLIIDVTVCPDRVGYCSHYEGGSIYFSPQTGAHEVRGAIRDRWLALGAERSFLGYPTAGEGNGPEGARVSQFQRGDMVVIRIAADPQPGAAGASTPPGHWTVYLLFGNRNEDGSASEANPRRTEPVDGVPQEANLPRPAEARNKVTPVIAEWLKQLAHNAAGEAGKAAVQYLTSWLPPRGP